ADLPGQREALLEVLHGAAVVADPLGCGGEVVEGADHARELAGSAAQSERDLEVRQGLPWPAPHAGQAAEVVAGAVALDRVGSVAVLVERLLRALDVASVELGAAHGVAGLRDQQFVAQPNGDLQRLQGALESVA